MPTTYLIRQGDSVSRLAERHGLSPRAVWDHPANADLRARRRSMDALMPGDEITLPDRHQKEVECASGRQHVFKRKGVPMLFQAQLLDERGRPRADRAYALTVDGAVLTGTTDGEGVLRRYIPNRADRGRLTMGGELDCEVLFGHMDPIETLSGVQKRLTNMGFPCAGDSGEAGRATFLAVRELQRLAGLDPTGQVDDRTREEIRACHEEPERLRRYLSQSRPLSF